jgi:hypothetical protein
LAQAIGHPISWRATAKCAKDFDAAFPREGGAPFRFQREARPMRCNHRLTYKPMRKMREMIARAHRVGAPFTELPPWS